MSEKQSNQQPTEPFLAQAAGRDDGATAPQSPQGQSSAPATVGTEGHGPAAPGEQAAGAPASERDLPPAHQDMVVAAASEAPRLKVVPGQKDEATAGPARPAQAAVHLPMAAAANRPAQTAARPAGLAAANRPAQAAARPPLAAPAKGQTPVTARNSDTMPLKPVQAKALPAEIEAWPELIEFDDFLKSKRQTRRRSFFTRLALFVGVPTFLMLLYVYVWATPRYVSEFEITYQAYQDTQSLSQGLVQSVLGGGTNGVDPGTIMYEYIRSATLLEKLNEKLDLRKYYSSKTVDYPARLDASAPEEKFLNYYRRHIVTVTEGLGGYVTVDVQAFDPQYAKAVAEAIVQASDEMVDQMSGRARQDEMKFAEEEVSREEDRVRQAQIAEARFQDLHRDLNPNTTANQFGQIVASIETQLSQTRTALTNTMSYASSSAPQVVQLQNQIAALEAQLKDQRNRLTGGTSTYSQILEEYASLQLEEQFAQNAYQSAQQGLAVARADAAKKESYLVDFVKPNLPSAPAETFYITYLGYAFFGTLVLYGIGSLMAGAFRDQAGL
jgi:capsular polysaccharide transport system permease protein